MTVRASIGLVVWLAACAPAPPPTHLFDEITPSVLPDEAVIPLDPTDHPCGTAICVGPSFGVGAAAGDVDRDGRPDLYLAGPDGGRLFLNRTAPGGPIVLAQAQVTLPRAYVHGAAFGDLDGDGAPELLLAAADGLHVLINQGGTLIESALLRRPLTRTAGVTVGDLDNDGLLDVYVAEYGEAGLPSAGAGRGLLLLNRGALVFEDLSTTWPGRHAWAGLMADLDRDGRLDLFVAAETWPDLVEEQPSSLYYNDGNDETGRPRLDDAEAHDRLRHFTAPMGAAAADVDGDGSLELIVTLIGPSLFLQRDPAGGPRDLIGRSYYGPQSAAETDQTSWGAAFGDFDLDGKLEMLLAGGAPCAVETCDGFHLRPWQESQLLKFAHDEFSYLAATPIPQAGGLAPADPAEQRDARGLVLVDLDGDGRAEVLLTPFQDRFHLYTSALHDGHPLRLLLRGAVSAIDPYGAEVTVVAGGRTQKLQLTSGGSTHSQSEPGLTFELGAASRADRVEIRWPSGLTQVLEGVDAGLRVVDEPPVLTVPVRRVKPGDEIVVFVQHADPSRDDPAGIELDASDGVAFALEPLGQGRFRAHRPAPATPTTLSLQLTLDGVALATRPALTVQ